LPEKGRKGRVGRPQRSRAAKNGCRTNKREFNTTKRKADEWKPLTYRGEKQHKLAKGNFTIWQEVYVDLQQKANTHLNFGRTKKKGNWGSANGFPAWGENGPYTMLGWQCHYETDRGRRHKQDNTWFWGVIRSRQWPREKRRPTSCRQKKNWVSRRGGGFRGTKSVRVKGAPGERFAKQSRKWWKSVRKREKKIILGGGNATQKAENTGYVKKGKMGSGP